MSDEPPFTAADFHNAVHKQIVNAVVETLSADKMDWAAVAPFLDLAREIARADFRRHGRIRLHTVPPGEGAPPEGEEAYLGVSVVGEDGEEWLAESYWLSDVARGDGDPDEVRRVAAALERSVARLREWLAGGAAEGSGGAGAAPPEGEAP